MRRPTGREVMGAGVGLAVAATAGFMVTADGGETAPTSVKFAAVCPGEAPLLIVSESDKGEDRHYARPRDHVGFKIVCHDVALNEVAVPAGFGLAEDVAPRTEAAAASTDIEYIVSVSGGFEEAYAGPDEGFAEDFETAKNDTGEYWDQGLEVELNGGWANLTTVDATAIAPSERQ